MVSDEITLEKLAILLHQLPNSLSNLYCLVGAAPSCTKSRTAISAPRRVGEGHIIGFRETDEIIVQEVKGGVSSKEMADGY